MQQGINILLRTGTAERFLDWGGGGEDQIRSACRRREVPLSRPRSGRERKRGFYVVSHPGDYFTHCDILKWLFLQ